MSRVPDGHTKQVYTTCDVKQAVGTEQTGYTRKDVSRLAQITHIKLFGDDIVVTISTIKHAKTTVKRIAKVPCGRSALHARASPERAAQVSKARLRT